MYFSLYLIGVQIFIMQWIPMSARTTPRTRWKSVRTKSPCVGTWLLVGGHKIWSRVPCAKRRNKDTPPPGKATPSMNLDELLPSLEQGPPHNETYDPSYGYEPYWADGAWVFDKRPQQKDQSQYMCGTRCSRVYTEYGEVCGRNKDFKYKTFENYCALKNEDCGGKYRWMMLYRGECYRELIIYTRHYLHTRVRENIGSLMKSYSNLPKYVGFCSEGPSKYSKKKKKRRRKKRRKKKK